MFRRGGRFLLATFAVVAVTFFLASGFAQVPAENDPRNVSDEYFDAVNGGKCFAHHGNDGFEPFGFSMLDNYAQLPIGEVVPLKLRIRHNSGIANEVQQLSVTVDTSQAPNVKVITPETINNTEYRMPFTLLNGDTAQRHLVPVLDGATELYVGVRAVGEPTGSQVGLGQGQLTVTGKTPSNRDLKIEGGPFYKYIRMEGDVLRDSGTGNFSLFMEWASQLDEQMDVEVAVNVNYTQTQTEFIFRAPADFKIRDGEKPPYDFEIPVIIESSDEAILDFRIQAVAYWDHHPTDAAPRDDGLYYRFLTMKLEGGDQLVRVDSAFGPQPVAPAVDLYNLFTRILGFVAALLIPMAMLTGGIFGKASRRWLNKVTGGAKKRVLWHSAMSWMIIGVASFHFLVALLEVKFVWTKGLLWGGLGWALLISLGFTGYYQVRMIKRWNYKVWRHTHLWSAVAVLVFTLVHLTLDGSDLVAVREALPRWTDKLIWP